MLAALALAIYVAALFGAGVSDLVRYEIPNWLSLAVAGAFVVMLPDLPPMVAAMHAAAGVTTLAVMAVGFWFGAIGGGDAKLLGAVGLWMGWGNLLPFLVLVSILGGMIGLLILALRALVPLPPAGRWSSRVLQGGAGVPYGLAIALAGLAFVPWLIPAALR
jgi:prepilin peptidase CpaA